MLQGYFPPTNRTASQRNIDKKQQLAQIITDPPQIINGMPQQTNKGGYVYRPPSRMVRTNVNIIKQAATQRTQIKKQQPSIIPSKVQPTKTISSVERPIYETNRQRLPSNLVSQANQFKEQVKPVVRPTSRLTGNRSNDPFQLFGSVPPKKQQPIKTVPSYMQPKLGHSSSVHSKSNNSLYIQQKQEQTKKPIQEKISPKNNTVVIKVTRDGIQRDTQLTIDDSSAKYVSALDMKKPAPFSYPKRLSRKVPENQNQHQEQKTQSKAPQEQLCKQTTKFNRYPVQQRIQTPAVPGFAYQRRPVGRVQGSQLLTKTDQKQPHKAVQYPVLKLEQNTLKSQRSQYPAKPPLSFTSRYSSRVQTSKSQQEQPQQQTLKLPIKRSPLVIFTLQRLFTQKLNDCFIQISFFSGKLKQNKGNQRLNQMFEKSLNKFVKKFQIQVLSRGAFSFIKTIYSKLIKNNYSKSIDPKISNHLIMKRNQCFGEVIQNILLPQTSLVKGAFIHLRNNSISAKAHELKVAFGARILGSVQCRLMKQHFHSISEWSMLKSKSKQILINRCCQISLCYRRFILKQVVNKLSLFKLRQLASQVKLTAYKSEQSMQRDPISQAVKDQQQPQGNKQLKQQISQLQAKIHQLRQKDKQAPQQQLRQKIKELEQQRQKTSSQLQSKRVANSQLRARLQLLNNKAYDGSNGQLSSLGDDVKVQNQESALQLVHDVYIRICRQSQQQCVSQEYLNSMGVIHRVEQNSTSLEMVAKCLAIHRGLQLKHQISLYQGDYSEGSGSSQTSATKLIYNQLSEENTIIKKLIRSYIKERYMWEQVRQHVSAVINQ